MTLGPLKVAKARQMTRGVTTASLLLVTTWLCSCRQPTGTSGIAKPSEPSMIVASGPPSCQDVEECERQCPERPEACVSAGRLYEFGHGVPSNPARAFGLYQQACGLNSLVGCYNVAVLLEAGHGTPQDLTRASELYGRVCAKGSPTACERSANLASKAKKLSGP